MDEERGGDDVREIPVDAYLKAVSDLLSEWYSPDDDEAFQDL